MPYLTEFAIMRHALVLEKDSTSCNSTSALLGSLGYLVTPVFRPKKALLAAQLIPFDIVFIHTTEMPDDRRSLASEIKRCAPLSLIVLVNEPGGHAYELGELESGDVDAVLQRPLTVAALQGVLDKLSAQGRPHTSREPRLPERRQWLSA